MLKQSKKILAVALVLIMGLLFTLSALAQTFDPEDGFAPGADGTVAITLTKNLQMPIGTTTPDVNFIFEAIRVSVDGTAATTTNMPLIGTPDDRTGTDLPNPHLGTFNISFNNTNTATPVGDIITITGTAATITLSPSMFNAPGVYVYHFRERANTNPAIDATTNTTESLQYSQAVYEMRVVVINCPDCLDDDCDDTDCTGLIIRQVIVTRTTTDNGTASTQKVAEMTFTNIYVVQDSLIIRKEVDGPLGQTEVYFPFTVTIFENPLIPPSAANPTYRAFIYDAGGSRITLPTAPAAAGPNGILADGTLGGDTYVIFVPGTARSFNLQDGQQIRFIDTPVGTRFVAAETNTLGHQVSASGIWTATRATATSLTTPTAEADRLLVQQNTNNIVIFENFRDLPPQTGLTMNDLPFVGMIVLAFGAFIGFVVFKVRKNKKAKAAAY